MRCNFRRRSPFFLGDATREVLKMVHSNLSVKCRPGWHEDFEMVRASGRTGVARARFRAVCASVCVWNVLSECA